MFGYNSEDDMEEEVSEVEEEEEEDLNSNPFYCNC